jgi:hypothetical protein
MYRVGDVFEDTYEATGDHLISVIDEIIHYDEDDSWVYMMRSVNNIDWMYELSTPSIEDKAFTYSMTPESLESEAKLLKI